MISNFFNGFCMALADSVPGVSGGTIAFILGFYEDLLESVNNVTSFNKSKMRQSIVFLIKLFVGWGIGMSASILFLSSMLQKNIYFLSSLFLGLTVASIIYIFRNEYSVFGDNRKNIILTILGILVVVILSYFRGRFVQNGSIDISNLDISEYIYIFMAGSIAISAMVLPGISGSTLLLIFGIYIPIINAMDMLLRRNVSVLPGLLIFLLGIIVGFIFSVKIIRTAFIRHRSKMIYLIIGLTIGSLYAIINGPTTLVKPMPSLNLTSFKPLGFIIGVGLILSLEAFKHMLQKSKKQTATNKK